MKRQEQSNNKIKKAQKKGYKKASQQNSKQDIQYREKKLKKEKNRRDNIYIERIV